MDMSALKRIQSNRQSRDKRQLLPNYEGWIEGTLDGDSGQDEVITRLMVWAIDAGLSAGRAHWALCRRAQPGDARPLQPHGSDSSGR
jgi:hypothetical protein